VNACRVVQVYVINAQPLQAVRQKIPDGDRAGVEADEAAVVIAQRAKLDGDEDAVTRKVFDGFADQLFIVSDAVKVAGVEKVDAQLQRVTDCLDALGVVRLAPAVKIRHAHAAQAHSRNLRVGASQLAIFHAWFPFPFAGPQPGAAFVGRVASRAAWGSSADLRP